MSIFLCQFVIFAKRLHKLRKSFNNLKLLNSLKKFFPGLLELEESLPKSVLQPQIKAPQKVPKEDLYKKKSNRLQRQLHEVYDVSFTYVVYAYNFLLYFGLMIRKNKNSL